MPVIRGQSNVIALSAARRQALLDQLTTELGGGRTLNGPLIFEIPLDQSDRMDVLVVWLAWENVRSEDRTKLILEAYGDQRERIALASGVTRQEAMEQQLLPYAVIPMIRGEKELAAVREAMLDEGGIALPGGKVDLRFPTMPMAEAAHRRLFAKAPHGFWSLVQTADQIA